MGSDLWLTGYDDIIPAWRRRAAALMRGNQWTTTTPTRLDGPMSESERPTDPSPPSSASDETTHHGDRHGRNGAVAYDEGAHVRLHQIMSAKLERVRDGILELRRDMNERIDSVLRELQMTEGGQDIVLHEGQLTAQRVTRTECEIAELKSRISRLPCGGRSGADCAAAE